jgi:hypothetical protein
VKVAVKPLYVGMIFPSSKNVKTAIAACLSENVCCSVDTTPLWAACHPIYTVNYHFFSQPNNRGRKMILSACNLVTAYAAVATGTFATVWADTHAVINKVTAVVTTRNLFFLFTHQIRLTII